MQARPSFARRHWQPTPVYPASPGSGRRPGRLAPPGSGSRIRRATRTPPAACCTGLPRRCERCPGAAGFPAPYRPGRPQARIDGRRPTPPRRAKCPERRVQRAVGRRPVAVLSWSKPCLRPAQALQRVPAAAMSCRCRWSPRAQYATARSRRRRRRRTPRCRRRRVVAGMLKGATYLATDTCLFIQSSSRERYSSLSLG